jgi:hypothetical protein
VRALEAALLRPDMLDLQAVVGGKLRLHAGMHVQHRDHRRALQQVELYIVLGLDQHKRGPWI